MIELRGLRVLGHHGVSDQERDSAQPFELDIDVVLDEGAGVAAAASDDVEDTVDYGLVSEEAAAVVSGSTFHLIESLAEAVANAVLKHDPVAEVTVVVRKLRPPVPVDLWTAGVRITRRRSGTGG
ncbi:MAG: dihydroneopterin aldolase [Acidimicrobiales bacterium]